MTKPHSNISSTETNQPAPDLLAAAKNATSHQERAGKTKLRRMVPTRRWVVHYRILVRSLLVFVGLLVLVNVWHWYIVQRNAAALLYRAEQQETEKEWSAASDSLRRYLTMMPGDADARLRSAQDLDHVAVTPAEKFKVLQLFAAAVSALPNEPEPRRRHIALTYELGDYPAALEQANLLLKNSPTDAVALKYRALALYSQWELKKEKSLVNLRQAFESAQKATPSDETIASRLARLYRVELRHPAPEERAKLADAVMDKLVETSDYAVAALVARHVFRQEFELPGADADLKWALENAEKLGDKLHDPAVFLAAGLHAQSSGDAETAIIYFRRAIEVAPDKPRAYLLLSLTFRGKGDLPATVKVLDEGLAAVGGRNLPLETQLASVRIELTEYKAASTVLNSMQSQAALLFGREQTEWLAMILSLRAELLLGQKDYLAAIPVLKRVLLLRQGGAAYDEKAVADARLHMQLGVCYATLAQWDQAALAYQAAAHLQPHRAVMRLAAAEAWDNAGWLDEAARQYEEALSLDDVPPKAWEAFAGALYRQQMRLSPAKREWNRVSQALNRAQTASADSASLQLLRVEYEIASGHLDLAAESLESVEAKVIEAPRLAVRLAQCYERLNRQNDADRVVAKLAGEKAGLLSALLKCELLLRRDRGDEAEQALTSAIASLSPADQNALRYRLAVVYLYRGKRDLAQKELAAVATSASEDLRPVQLSAEMALETRDWPDVERQEQRLKEMEKVEGQSGWQFYRAQRLLGQAAKTEDTALRDNQIHEAQALETELERLRPYWAPTYLLKGRLAQVGTKPDDDVAIQAYSEALRLGERRIQLYQELISLLFRRHRVAEAAALIDRLRESDNVPEELVSLAVAADVSQGNVARAVRLATNEVRRDPDDAFGHLRLGQLLALNLPADASAKKARLEEAESELKRAQELSPRDSRVWSALLAFYHTTGQAELARQTLAQVGSEDFLSDKDKPFFLAQGYALVGDNEQAKKFYLDAIDANPDRVGVLLQAGDFFFRIEPERAEKLLRHAMEVEPGEPTAARKLAALIAVRSTTDKEMDEVWQLLNANSSQGMPDVADERLRAVLLLRRGGSRARKQAQQVLESLIAGGSEAPLDRLLLARLYEAQGEIEKAREQLETLVQKGKSDPAHLAAYADHLLRTADKDAAAATRLAQILDQLSSLEPESKFFRTLGLRARWLKLADRNAEVPGLIGTFLAQPLPASDTVRKTQRLLMVAGLYETLDLPAEAETCYRQAVEISPRAYRPLATWLARHQRPQEAIDLCAKASEEDKSSAPAVSLAAVLTVGSATSEQRTAAEPLLAQALAKHPDDRALLFGVATLRLMQHEDEDAERLLRRFLQLEPRNVPAMNNLAMLLSEQREGAAEALQLIERAMAIAGAQSELFDTKGWVLLEQKRFPEAESNFQEALAMPPDSPRYRFHLALSYSHQGKEDDAQAMLQKALAENLSSELLSPRERDELRKLEINNK